MFMFSEQSSAHADLKCPGFECHRLDDRHQIFVGQLPSEFAVDDSQFEELWNEHPQEFHEIRMRGRLVNTPRWQQAYGKDYHYTGRVNKAVPVLPVLRPLLSWCQESFDPRLNGILLNWYDAALGHYMGAHRDSTINMLEGAPIITVSLGETRTFRLRPWKARGKQDFEARHGNVFVMPYDTNQAWTHEVPKGKRYSARRISITVRAFE